MKMFLYLLICVGLLLMGGITLQAATWELVPKVGYGLHTPQDFAAPRYDRLRIKNEPLVGVSLGYLTAESGQLEISWTHSNTSAHLEQAAGNPPDVFRIGVDQIHFNGLYMVQPAPFQPYGLLGLGVTRYTSQQHSDHTRFSFAAGGGVKWLWNDYLGLRFEGKWIPMWVPKGTHLFCPENGTSGCPSTEANSYFGRQFPFIQAFEFTTGLIVRY